MKWYLGHLKILDFVLIYCAAYSEDAIPEQFYIICGTYMS